MASSAIQFPRPDRGNRKKSEKSDFYWEIDEGQSDIVMDDGRPALIEYWFDTETRADCITAFYSVLGIEEWSDNDHRSYLIRNKVLKTAVGLSADQTVDGSKNAMWSVTFVTGFAKD